MEETGRDVPLHPGVLATPTSPTGPAWETVQRWQAGRQALPRGRLLRGQPPLAGPGVADTLTSSRTGSGTWSCPPRPSGRTTWEHDRGRKRRSWPTARLAMASTSRLSWSSSCILLQSATAWPMPYNGIGRAADEERLTQTGPRERSSRPHAEIHAGPPQPRSMRRPDDPALRGDGLQVREVQAPMATEVRLEHEAAGGGGDGPPALLGPRGAPRPVRWSNGPTPTHGPGPSPGMGIPGHADERLVIARGASTTCSSPGWEGRSTWTRPWPSPPRTSRAHRGPRPPLRRTHHGRLGPVHHALA